MPRRFESQHILSTDQVALENAFKHRVETGCSIRTAANLFGVKATTLWDAFAKSKKQSDGKTFVQKAHNANKVFTDAQESKIEDYSVNIAKMFYGLSTRAFRRMVLKYAEAVGSPAIPEGWWVEGMASRDWYYGFMHRHPRLALKAPEGMSLARAMAFNRVNVEVFFKAYVEAVERHSFMPARIFNLDESGLSTVMKPCKVVCERGRPVASQVARERGNHMTFVGIVNAAGQGFPPVFIIARKKMNADFLRGTTAETTVLLQSNGWMDHACFVQTLQHLQKVSYSSLENKILLIMDNAECHMNIHAVEYAIRHGIVIVTLPPHTTAKLQPLDVSVFGPFKSVLRAIQDDFKLSNPHVPITEHILPEMACKAWDKVCNVTNITNGFRATGIFPINRNIFPDDAFVGAEVSEQAPPDDDDDLPLTVAPPLTPSSEQDQPQPGPSGIGRMSPVFSASAASTPEAAPQPHLTPTPTAPPPVVDVTPEAVQPYPKAPPRPAARGRKKIRACILTEDEEALDQLREKQEKKAAREEKKRMLEKKREQAAKRAKRSDPVEGSSSDEQAADNPAALCDDSSEYSDEFAEELVPDADSYPFIKKEPEDHLDSKKNRNMETCDCDFFECKSDPLGSEEETNIDTLVNTDFENEGTPNSAEIIFIKEEPLEFEDNTNSDDTQMPSIVQHNKTNKFEDNTDSDDNNFMMRNPVSKAFRDKLKLLMDALYEAIVRYGNEQTLEALDGLINRVRNVRSSHQLNSLLQCMGADLPCIGRGKIPCQPTSIARRQQGMPRGAAPNTKSRKRRNLIHKALKENVILP